MLDTPKRAVNEAVRGYALGVNDNLAGPESQAFEPCRPHQFSRAFSGTPKETLQSYQCGILRKPWDTLFPSL